MVWGSTAVRDPGTSVLLLHVLARGFLPRGSKQLPEPQPSHLCSRSREKRNAKDREVFLPGVF